MFISICEKNTWNFLNIGTEMLLLTQCDINIGRDHQLRRCHKRTISHIPFNISLAKCIDILFISISMHNNFIFDHLK